MRDIIKIIIHCAATPNGKSFSVYDIDKWHWDRGFRRSAKPQDDLRGLNSVGYHYIITLSGEVQQGRTEGEVGAHAFGHNHDSIGVCLIGTNKFTRSQWWALRDLVRDLEERYGITKIVGHRDLPGVNKECPGFSVADWITTFMNALPDHILENESDA
jgi:N-acetyl-anhydromuramyl-L-alanine amidase AmpD